MRNERYNWNSSKGHSTGGGGEYPTYVGVKGGYLGGLECMGMHRCGNNLGGTTYCSMNVDI